MLQLTAFLNHACLLMLVGVARCIFPSFPIGTIKRTVPLSEVDVCFLPCRSREHWEGREDHPVERAKIDARTGERDRLGGHMMRGNVLRIQGKNR